jgi:hypothetical protein
MKVFILFDNEWDLLPNYARAESLGNPHTHLNWGREGRRIKVTTDVPSLSDKSENM